MRPLLRHSLAPLLLSCFVACAPPDAEPSPDAGTASAELGDERAPGAGAAVAAIDEGATDTLRAAINTTITSGPSGTTSTPSATFGFTSNRATAHFQCRLDAASWTACAAPASYAGLADGAHTFRVRACTTSCDTTPAVRTWTVATATLDTVITAGPPAVVATTSATFAFASTGTATFRCQLDGAAWTVCTTPTSYAGLAAGSHTFAVRACDAAGTCDPSPALSTWTIDITAPDSVITSAPPAVTNVQSATFAFTATEAGTFNCRIDGAVWSVCTAPVSYAGLAAGSHTFAVRACDVVGNCDPTPAMATWVIDTIAPDTIITIAPPSITSATTATFGFTASEPATIACRIDAGPFLACTSPMSVTSLAAGAHVFAVRACDGAGNCDPSPASYAWTIDPTAP
jgi:hypothetical protein